MTELTLEVDDIKQVTTAEEDGFYVTMYDLGDLRLTIIQPVAEEGGEGE